MAGRILVLDDEENYAEMLQDLLRENNFRVDMATRPERAIDQLEDIPYDLVISDYKMPVMDGADFLKKARELYPNLPFILVSGLMNTPELVKVANMSVTLVMEKPLNTEVFLKQVARFSEPMTVEEKAAQALDSKNGMAATSIAYSYPEEPRFFSAGCSVSKRFMQNVWNICKDGSHCFILEPKGGEGDLAIKDVSVWRGNSDQPVTTLAFADLLAGGVAPVKAILEQPECSNVLAVRLNCPEQITEAKSIVAKWQEVCDRPNGILFVYLLEADLTGADFKKLAGKFGEALPSLCERPTDVALYARRFARLAADRLGKSQCAEFLSEVVYAILAFNWPGNYKQLQEVIPAAVSASEDAPLSLAVLQEVMGSDVDTIPAPSARLSSLIQLAQQRYIEKALGTSPAADVARDLGLDSSFRTPDDLKRMPLITEKIGHI